MKNEGNSEIVVGEKTIITIEARQIITIHGQEIDIVKKTETTSKANIIKEQKESFIVENKKKGLSISEESQATLFRVMAKTWRRKEEYFLFNEED